MGEGEPSAEDLFAGYVARREDGEEIDFESWARQYPNQEAELRRLFKGWSTFEDELKGEKEDKGVSFFKRRHRERSKPAPGLAEGKVVSGYRLVSIIGQGGMGQVWEAEQISVGGRRVALKFVRPDRITPRQLELFKREARAGGRLNHEGMVRVLDYGEDGDLAWIAMEYVEGCWTLRDCLDEVGREEEVPEGYDRHVARFIAHAADAVEAAHQAGVIHRDLKPQNILITQEDTPKITDFGLARITDETAISVTGEVAGSWHYMSPEQVAAKRIGLDHRTDVFSLGVVLYEMLALQRPFEGDTKEQLAYQIMQKEPPDLRNRSSRIPRDLAVICGKALAKDRARRYATMAEFALDLRRHLADEPILAQPPRLWERVLRWTRRHLTKIVVGSVAALVLGTLSLLLWQNHQTAQLEDRARLADGLTVARLEAEADELWPVDPSRIRAYEEWIEAAQGVVSRLPLHRATLSEAKGQEARSWDDALNGIITELEDLADPETGLIEGISPEHGLGMRRRLALARRLQQVSAPEGDASGRWKEAITAIRENPKYRGLELAPQIGLVPIGMNPDSGLWEFWHVPTGEEPTRDAEGGLIIAEATALVFVLVPPGVVRDVRVEPLFLSKYTMTRGQWKQITGHADPLLSEAGEPDDPERRLTGPVRAWPGPTLESVCFRLGVGFPTFDQWDYAVSTFNRESGDKRAVDLGSVDTFPVNDFGIHYDPLVNELVMGDEASFSFRGIVVEGRDPAAKISSIRPIMRVIK